MLTYGTAGERPFVEDPPGQRCCDATACSRSSQPETKPLPGLPSETGMRLAAMLLSCAIVAGCRDAATPAPTSPSPPALPVDTVSVQGRWEGTFLYDRVEPSGCL